MKFSVWCFRYEERFAKHVDLWLHFATKAANLQELTLGLFPINEDQNYDFPQFAFKNGSFFKDLDLRHCQLNPRASVNWTSLISLKIGHNKLTNAAMKKVLSGCPNLKCLKLESISGIHHLEISSLKTRQLMMEDYYNNDHDIWLKILSPHIQHLEILGLCGEIRIIQKNVPSLVTAILHLNFDFEDQEDNDLDKEFSYWKELLHSVVYVENLELGT